MDNEIEKRCFSAVELRVDEQDGKSRVTGLAVPYNQPSEMMWDFREVFKPGAFKESLAGSDDMFANVEHQSTSKLARRSIRTLDFKEKRDGLYATITLPDTTLGRDTLEEVRSGLLDAMSIEFAGPDESFTGKGDNIVREISKAKLRGVALTSYPAYRQTIGKLVARSLEEYRKETEEAERGGKEENRLEPPAESETNEPLQDLGEAERLRMKVDLEEAKLDC